MQVNDDGKPTVDKCNVYDLDYKSLNKLSIEQGTSPNELFGQNLTTKNCTNFQYDKSEIESSIVTDVSPIFILISSSGSVNSRFHGKCTLESNFRHFTETRFTSLLHFL